MTDGSYDGTEVCKRLGSESGDVPMRPVTLGIAVARTQIHIFLDLIQSVSPSAPSLLHRHSVNEVPRVSARCPVIGISIGKC